MLSVLESSKTQPAQPPSGRIAHLNLPIHYQLSTNIIGLDLIGAIPYSFGSNLFMFPFFLIFLNHLNQCFAR
ncbi:MAG: hypothetical protein LBK82_14785 [Planctomycetaceae bacterium]|nr:hypothetical protein [Planctomycetaceae bacterium]